VVEVGSMKPGDEPTEESWAAFEHYLVASFPAGRVERVKDQSAVSTIRFGFKIKLIDGMHVVHVTHDFWKDTVASQMERELSLLNLADAIQRYKRVTMVIKKGKPVAQGH
jgi:hypothetical protein